MRSLQNKNLKEYQKCIMLYYLMINSVHQVVICLQLFSQQKNYISFFNNNNQVSIFPLSTYFTFCITFVQLNTCKPQPAIKHRGAVTALWCPSCQINKTIRQTTQQFLLLNMPIYYVFLHSCTPQYQKIIYFNLQQIVKTGCLVIYQSFF